MQEITDEYVKYYIENYSKLTSKRPIFKSFDEQIKTYILNRYSDSVSYKESIYRILNNIEVRPTCKYCGNYVKFSRGHFNEYCCKNIVR